MICSLTGLHAIVSAAGRYSVKVIDHPKACKSGFILRSRYIMEKHLGRYLESWEEVHHKDEDTTNDSLDNLEVMSKADHARHHMKLKKPKLLDYSKIKEYVLIGYGYKRISKLLEYKESSTRDAVRKIKIEIGGDKVSYL